MNEINSVIVLSIYFGNRAIVPYSYPFDGDDTLYVIYDALNHYRHFNFGVPCDIVVINHDITTFPDFKNCISEERQKFYVKSKQLLDMFNGEKLLHGGWVIKIMHRDWNNGNGMAMASFQFVYNENKYKYKYWFYNSDDTKIMKENCFKDMIDKLNSDDKIGFVSIYQTAGIGVTSSFYLDKLYDSLKDMSFITEISKEFQIKFLNKIVKLSDEYVEQYVKRYKLENYVIQWDWNGFFNNIGYSVIAGAQDMRGDYLHRYGKDQNYTAKFPKIIINEKDEPIIIYPDGNQEKIDKWINE